LPASVGATTVNKLCGSGMRAVMLAHDAISLGSSDIVVAGGMESMSNAPFLVARSEGNRPASDDGFRDSMYIDGLEDVYDSGTHMGVFAENTAQAYQFTRADQDAFAELTLGRAQAAISDGTFGREIIPVPVTIDGAPRVVDTDELPLRLKAERIATLRPAFRENGSVTAANSSSIADGAAALVLMRRSEADRRELRPRALIHGHATHSQAPEWFTTAPVGAVRKLFEKTGWTAEGADLFEINEAFAVVTMAATRDLGLSSENVNIHGGACALGHPIGASGARIVVTLLNALECHDLKTGIATICIGGGEATALAIERLT
jgi:acetyl-CoA C-acetyltransferase